MFGRPEPTRSEDDAILRGIQLLAIGDSYSKAAKSVSMTKSALIGSVSRVRKHDIKHEPGAAEFWGIE